MVGPVVCVAWVAGVNAPAQQRGFAKLWLAAWSKRIERMAENADLEVAVGWTPETDEEVRLRAAVNEFGDDDGSGHPPARMALGANIAGKRQALSNPLIVAAKAVVRLAVKAPSPSVHTAMQPLREKADLLVRSGIRSGMAPELAASTKEKRDRENKPHTPLIDSGAMLQQMKAVVRKVIKVKRGETT